MFVGKSYCQKQTLCKIMQVIQYELYMIKIEMFLSFSTNNIKDEKY